MARPRTSTTQKVVDKAFARRLEEACNLNPHVPDPNFGRLRFFQEEFQKRGVTISAQAIDKWFKGYSRPNFRRMTILANILNVDEPWLSLGYTQNTSNVKAREPVGEGAIHLVIGVLSLSGGAFRWADSDEAGSAIHFFATLDGKQLSFHVGGIVSDQGTVQITIAADTKADRVIGVLPRSPVDFHLYELKASGAMKRGRRRSDVVRLEGILSDEILTIAGTSVNRLNDPADLWT